MRISKRRRLIVELIFSFAIVACCLPVAKADTFTFFPLFSQDWSNWQSWQNWNTSSYNLGPPGVNDTAYVDSGTVAAGVGGSGSGTCYDLYIGSGNGCVGTVQITGYSLSVTDNEYLGNQGTGYLTQSGGTHTVGTALYLGNYSTSGGSYTLNAGLLSAPYECVGDAGIGIFTQTGGTNSVGSTGLYLGYAQSGSGYYTLSTGALSASYECVGYQGIGHFTQTGGTNSITGASGLCLAASASATGVYYLNGGLLRLSALTTGPGTGQVRFNGGSGTLQAAGSFTASAPIVVNNAGSSAVIDTGNYNVTFSGGIFSYQNPTSCNLLKIGSGTLVLAVGDSFSGSTSISAGVLNLSNSCALLNSTLTAPTSGSIVFDQSVTGTTFYLGALTGSGNLVLQNNATSPAGICLAVGCNNSSTTYAGALSGPGSLWQLGTGAIVLAGTNTFTGGTTITGGTLQLGTGVIGADGSVAGNIADNAALVYNLAGSQTYSGAISGTGSLTKIGGGTLALAGSTYFTGPTTITGGVLTLCNSAALQGSTVTTPVPGSLVFDQSVTGSTFYFGGLSGSNGLVLQNNAPSPGPVFLAVGGNNANTTYSGVLSGSGALTMAGSGVLTLTGSNTYSGGTAISAGTLQLGTGASGNDGSVSGNISNSAALVYDLNGSQTYSGVINGTGNLTKIGGGMLILQGANTYSGTTAVASGTLHLANAAAVQESTVYPNGGSIVFDPSVTSHDFTFGGLMGSGGVSLQDSSGNAVTLTVGNNDASTTYSGSLTGSGGLNKIGAGELTLTGANSYAGATAVNGGWLAVTGTGALPNYTNGSMVTVSSGAALVVSAGSSWTATNIGSLLSQNGAGFAPGSALGIDTTSASFTYGNSISGNMGLTKIGPNMLTLSSSNSFAGPTTVVAGSLTLANASALYGSTLVAPTAGGVLFANAGSYTLGGFSGAGNLALQSGSTGIALIVGGNGASTVYSGTMSGSGSLTKTGNGALTLTGSNTYSGGTTITGGTLELGTGVSGYDGSVAGNIADNAALVYNLAGSQTYSAIISGTGSLNKAGGGTLILTGANLFTGPTTITGGVLNLSGGSALQGSNVVVPAPGGLVFDQSVAGNPPTFCFGGLSGSGNLALQNNASSPSAVLLLVGCNNGNSTYSGALGGSGWLWKAGTGVQTLTGSNTNTGGTIIAAGTLQLGNGMSGFDGSLFGNVADNAMLVYDLYGPQSVLGSISGSGSLNKIGGGTLTLSGSNYYTGGTTVGAGVLTVASTAALPGYNLASEVAVGGSGTLTVLVGGNGWTASNINSLVGSNRSGFAAGSALGIDTTSATSNFSYGSVISGSMGLTKFGPNALILTASNVYSGVTNIAAGTLQLGIATSGSDGSLSGVGGIIDNAALVYDLYGAQTYSGVISGTGSLSKIGSGSLTLSNSSTFSGPTTISGGSLVLGNGNALQSSTVTAPTAGSLVFANSGGYTFGGLSGSGNLSLQSGTAAVALTVGGNGASANYSGNLTGSGSLTKAGGGTVTLTGSNTISGGVTISGGMLTVASNGALTTGSSQNLNIGYNSPAAMTIQDSATVKVGGALEMDYSYSGATPSTLTLTGGSLHVAGQTLIGQATSGDPTYTGAAFYQSGGTASLAGTVTIGYSGRDENVYDISGGVLSATGGGGLWVGGASGGQGNGLLNIQGSAVVNVSGGLQIGQDASRATGGTVSLSSGTLNVTGNLTLGTNSGSGGGMALFSRSGGAMSVTGNLVVDGNATLLLDGTTGTVATTFGGGLSWNGLGTLVVVPETGNLSASEAVFFTTPPALTHNILGPFAVVQASGSNTAGDYLATTATTLNGHTYYQLATLSGSNYNTNFSQSGSGVLENATAATTLTSNWSVYAMKSSGTTTLTGETLTVCSGGMIFNGGELSGGTLSFNNNGQWATPLIYAGSSTAGTIASAITSSLGLVKFGPGTLVLAANSSNTLSGGVLITGGTLNVQNSGALGGAGSAATVAAGASLDLQGNSSISVGDVPITISGSGAGGGALQNVSGSNSLGGPVTLASNSEIDVLAGTLTLTGSVLTPTLQSYSMTKAGSGTLVLAGASGSAFPSQVTVASGALQVQNSAALGPGGSGAVTVNTGATLQLQNGIAIPTVPLTLNGTGANNNGALENLQGANSFAGNITLAGNSQVNIDNAADTLTLSGVIGGGFSLTQAGPGTLVLSGSNTFMGALNILSGTLSVPSLNNAGTAGPLGEGAAPVVLGSNGATATFLSPGGGSTNQAFTLAAGGTGVFSASGGLTLSGAIGGNGSLATVGNVTLAGSNAYTGTTTVSNGTLTIGSGGSINGTSGISVAQGCLLQVTAGGGGGQLPGAGNIILSAGTLNYLGNGSASPGETTGALLLNPGQSTVATSNAGTGSTYLCFASGAPSAVTGATVNFSGSNNAQIQFQSNPPSGNGGIIGGYAFYINGNNTDFAALTADSSGGPYTLGACSNYATGNLVSCGTAANAKPSGAQSSLSTATTINSLNLSGTAGVTMTGGGSLMLTSGGLIGNTTGSISGGTLMGSSSGELVVNAVQPLSISSVIADNGDPTALVKTGSGTLTLTSPSTFSGNIFLNQGTLTYSLASSMSYGGAISGIGGLTKSGNATLVLTGNNTYSGPTTISQGNLVVNGTLLSSGNVQVNNALLSGTGSVGNVFVNGGGTLAVGNGANTMSAAALTLTANSFLNIYTAAGYNPLAVSGAVALPSSGVTTLDLTNSSLTALGTYHLLDYGSLSGLSTSSFTIGTSPPAGDMFTIQVDPGNYLDLVISKSPVTGTWNHSGSGTWSSSGNWSGSVPGVGQDTAVFGNVLTGSTVATVTLDSSRSLSNLGFSTTGANSYVIAPSAGSTLTLLSSTGGVSPTISDSGGNQTVRVAVTLSSNLSVSVTSGSALTIAGDISESGGSQSLSVSGGGELILSGTDSYTGGTTISGGTLVLATAAALPSSGLVTIASGGWLELGGGSGIDSLFATSAPMESGAGILLSDVANSQATVSLGDVGGALETLQYPPGGAVSWPPADPGGGGSTTANAVPEPGALALALAAAVGLGLILRRRGMR